MKTGKNNVSAFVHSIRDVCDAQDDGRTGMKWWRERKCHIRVQIHRVQWYISIRYEKE